MRVILNMAIEICEQLNVLTKRIKNIPPSDRAIAT